MKILQRTREVLTRPTEYFRNINKEKELKDAFVCYFIYSLAFGTAGLIAVYFLQPLLMPLYSSLYHLIGLEKLADIISKAPRSSFMAMIIYFILFYPFKLGFSFLWAAILHVWILIFEGQADYKKTYQLYAYTKTPIFIFGWIPFIGMLASIYRLVLLIYGTSEVHKIKLRTSALMYIIPYALLKLFSIAVIVSAFLILSRLGIDNAINPGDYLPQ